MSRDPVLTAAAHLLSDNRPADAESRLRAHLAATPDSAPGLVLLAHALKRQDRLAEALDAAQTAAGVAPEDPHCHLTLSDLSIRQGDSARAIASAEEAVRLEPTSWVTHYSLGRALLHAPRHRLGDAHAAATRAAALGPEQPQVHTLLGWCLQESGDPAGARRALEEALRLDPHASWAMNNLAVLDLSERHLGDATRSLSGALAADPHEGVLVRNSRVLLQLVVMRFYVAVLAGGALLGVAGLAESPRVVRAGLGIALLATYTWLVIVWRRDLPRGIRNERWRALRHLPWVLRIQVVVVVLVLAVLLTMAFAPREVARPAGGLMLAVLLGTVPPLVFLSIQSRTRSRTRLA